MDNSSSFKTQEKDYVTPSDETLLEFRNAAEGVDGDASLINSKNCANTVDIGRGATVNINNPKESGAFLTINGHGDDRSETVIKQDSESVRGHFDTRDKIVHGDKFSDTGHEVEMLTKLSDSQQRQDIQDSKSEFKPSVTESEEGDTHTLTEDSLSPNETLYLDVENRTRNFDSELDAEANSSEKLDTRWSYARVASKDSAFSDSPTSDFEFSTSSSLTSCTEDSGVSSSVRDDDLEEIPLYDKSCSPDKPATLHEAQLQKQISALSVNEHLPPSWMPKSLNTYAPAQAADDMNDGGTKKQSKFK